MPEVSRFFGIVIKIFREEHPPPHFHAEYGEYEALIAIHTLTVIEGNLPSRSLGMVIEWASEHRDELDDLWHRAVNHQPMYKIPPLK